MSDPVVRDLDIVSVERNTTTKLHDMIFVDNRNDGDSREDGSLSHPHNTLAEAFSDPLYEEGVWIYMRRGDGTAEGYTGSFTLADRSTLWGEGYRYLNLGGDGYPLIDGAGGAAVITLGQDTTVMGLQVQNADIGISGENFGSAAIHHNIITQNGVGISLLTSAADTTSSGVISHNMIADNSGSGIEARAENFSTFHFTCTNNTIRDTTVGSAIALITGDIAPAADTSELRATITGNSLTANNANGIYLQSNWATRLSALVSKNTITGNGLYGVYLDDVGTSVLNLDLGNGTLGSAGENSIFGNTSYHVYNNTELTVKAENNWWGKATPEAFKFRRSVDYDPWLTQAPD
jgi:hypothetical protein